MGDVTDAVAVESVAFNGTTVGTGDVIGRGTGVETAAVR
jgi:hypothetical protein